MSGIMVVELPTSTSLFKKIGERTDNFRKQFHGCKQKPKVTKLAEEQNCNMAVVADMSSLRGTSY